MAKTNETNETKIQKSVTTLRGVSGLRQPQERRVAQAKRILKGQVSTGKGKNHSTRLRNYRDFLKDVQTNCGCAALLVCILSFAQTEIGDLSKQGRKNLIETISRKSFSDELDILACANGLDVSAVEDSGGIKDGDATVEEYAGQKGGDGGIVRPITTAEGFDGLWRHFEARNVGALSTLFVERISKDIAKALGERSEATPIRLQARLPTENFQDGIVWLEVGPALDLATHLFPVEKAKLLALLSIPCGYDGACTTGEFIDVFFYIHTNM